MRDIFLIKLPGKVRENDQGLWVKGPEERRDASLK